MLERYLEEGNTKQFLTEWSEAVENAILDAGEITSQNERKNSKDTGAFSYKKRRYPSLGNAINIPMRWIP